MDVKTALRILGLAEGATLDAVEKARRKLLLAFHPDKHPPNQADIFTRQTRDVIEAAGFLSNGGLHIALPVTSSNSQEAHNRNYSDRPVGFQRTVDINQFFFETRDPAKIREISKSVVKKLLNELAEYPKIDRIAAAGRSGSALTFDKAIDDLCDWADRNRIWLGWD